MGGLITSTKTVVVLGASYGGARAAQNLAAGLPNGWRVILIDRNSHANHVYVMPRFSVLSGHEVKAFIPYTNIFRSDSNSSASPHISLHAHVTSIRPTHITLSKAFPDFGISTKLPFDYAVYALGSHMPGPLNLWEKQLERKAPCDAKDHTYDGTKKEAVQWLKKRQVLIETSDAVLVVGGGALGIQFATDIKAVYPTKKVTLLHSRDRLLPRFDEKMHAEISEYMHSVGIELILGERLDLSSLENEKAKVNPEGKKVVRTEKGREISTDLLLLCTGQSPNTELLRAMDPAVIGDNKLVKVLRSMQLGLVARSDDDQESPYPNIFAIGDAADAFGAIAAGHTAHYQGEVVARNIIRLVEKDEKNVDMEEKYELEKYAPGQPAIKISLGLHKVISQNGPQIGSTTDCADDLRALTMWPYFGMKVEMDEDMYL
ncbi:hypothetical protein BDQ17DRAFT_1367175 [Cyathus striatus]|nr:hypothetical protein BDQ17DRAFT_1367175 [Cyathus striatus]